MKGIEFESCSAVTKADAGGCWVEQRRNTALESCAGMRVISLGQACTTLGHPHLFVPLRPPPWPSKLCSKSEFSKCITIGNMVSSGVLNNGIAP